MKTESFYDIGAVLLEQRMSETDLGLAIVDTVVQNRKDNVEAYKSGRQKDFRNKEENRMFRTLEAIAAQEQQAPLLAEVIGRHSERLEAYRDIYFINFGYDAAKFHYLSIRDLERTAVFLGKRFLTVFGRQPAQQETQWEKRNYDHKTEEYLKYLTALRAKLQKEFRVVFSR